MWGCWSLWPARRIKAEEKTATVPDESTTEKGIDTATTPDVAAKIPDAGATVACTVDGNYRFRFASNGSSSAARIP